MFNTCTVPNFIKFTYYDGSYIHVHLILSGTVSKNQPFEAIFMAHRAIPMIAFLKFNKVL